MNVELDLKCCFLIFKFGEDIFLSILNSKLSPHPTHHGVKREKYV